MKTERQKVGKEGEDHACRYLESIGHTIIARNYRKSHTEIDIITLDPEGIHFVEVKTRMAPSAADPEDNVDYRKKKNMVNAAKDYIHSDECPKGNYEFFFDVIAVWLFEDHHSIDYYPRAFVPIYV